MVLVGTDAGTESGDGQVALRVRRGDGTALVLARIDGARELEGPELRRRTAELYDRLRRAAADAGAPHPVRLWNFIPFIHERLHDGLDRYMTFNAGRHDAMTRWLGEDEELSRNVPTATGVGFRGEDLHVWCLSSARPGIPAENPRQRPAYRYSTRFGPKPPCFARATVCILGARPTLLVGGTAAVRGEESVFAGSVARQLEETFENLDSLVHNTGGGDPAQRYEALRAYYVDPGDAATVRRAVAQRYPALHELELVRADICRPELLVEIEGCARLPGAEPR